MAEVVVSMRLGDWKFIDATMDNVGALNREQWSNESDERKATRADAIRRRAWAITRPIEQPMIDAGRWPPDEHALATTLTVSLEVENWRFIVDVLREGERRAKSLQEPTDDYHRLLALIVNAVE